MKQEEQINENGRAFNGNLKAFIPMLVMFAVGALWLGFQAVKWLALLLIAMF